METVTTAVGQAFPDDTSLQVFRRFIVANPLSDAVDASGVLSSACYLKWLQTRRVSPGKPEESFRRVLTAHVRGSDGRKPFHEEEEKQLLVELRKKRVWPCFLDTGSRIGINGFRAVGYHERKGRTDLFETQDASDSASNQSPVVPEAESEEPEPSKEENKTSSEARSKFLSSYEVFVKFAEPDDQGVSMILSKQCYETWVGTRRNGVKSAEHSFRKALIAHLCGRDGRRPFPPELETFVVKELRKKQTWPCFEGRSESHVLNIGKKGFRHLGFHEEKQQNKPSSSLHPIPDQHKMANLLHYFSTTPTVLNSQSENLKTRPEKSVPLTLPLPKKHRSEGNTFLANTLETMMKLSPFNFRPQHQLQFNADGAFPIWQQQPSLDYLPSQHPLGSILETFAAVPREEVAKVIHLKAASEFLFKAHFAITDLEEMPREVVGDVKLLRILRMCHGNVTEAKKEVEAILNWRRIEDVESIRRDLIRDDVSFDELRRELTIGKRGGCYPFYAQDTNGDLVEMWVLQTQTDDSEEEMAEDLRSHLKVCEFRAIVLDRLSYLTKRIVCFKIISDWRAIHDDSHAETIQEGGIFKTTVTWWVALQKWKEFLKMIATLYTRWYGGTCLGLDVFGKGALFNMLSSALNQILMGALVGSGITFYSREDEFHQTLKLHLGEQSNWPLFMGGTKNPEKTVLSQTKLSQFLQ